ncbi:hypothetical protein A9Q83_04205 [Alphaproteobacteria bacterium 46_93_T64]|nr:hypothetical protein A9Q83_04205 [Alphaproteobacteria bacterium 46_93_T64]
MTDIEPRIGNWWYWKDVVYDFSVPLSEAEKIEGFYNGPHCHVDAWPNSQNSNNDFGTKTILMSNGAV